MPSEDLWLAQGQDLPWPRIEWLLRARVQAYADWVSASDPARTHVAALCVSAVERIVSAIRPLADTSFTPGFCHRDPRFANVIEGHDGQLTLVDWEGSGLRDPAIDVACVLRHPNQEDLLGLPEWSAFLEPDLAARAGHDPTLRERIELWCA